MKNYVVNDYSFDALCAHNIGPQIDTLAYLVGLVNSDRHVASNPDTARFDILIPLSEGEEQAESPEDLIGMQAEFLPDDYLPQTPVMFARRWSPIFAMIEKGFEPISLARDAENGPHAVASGIWRPGVVEDTQDIAYCTTDEDLFWARCSRVQATVDGL